MRSGGGGGGRGTSRSICGHTITITISSSSSSSGNVNDLCGPVHPLPLCVFTGEIASGVASWCQLRRTSHDCVPHRRRERGNWGFRVWTPHFPSQDWSPGDTPSFSHCRNHTDCLNFATPRLSEVKMATGLIGTEARRGEARLPAGLLTYFPADVGE